MPRGRSLARTGAHAKPKMPAALIIDLIAPRKLRTVMGLLHLQRRSRSAVIEPTTRRTAAGRASPLLGRLAPRAGFVALRQTFVRRCQNCVAWAAVIARRARPAQLR